MNTETQNLIAKSVNRFRFMMDQGFPDVLIQMELEHLAKLWNVDSECAFKLVMPSKLWNITGEVGEC